MGDRDKAKTAFSVVRYVDRFLARYLRGLLPEEKRYWLLVPVTGVIAGLVSVLLVRFLELIQTAAWGGSPTTSADLNTFQVELPSGTPLEVTDPQLFLIVPTIGGVVVAIYLFLVRRRARTPEGTTALIEALAVGQGRVPLVGTLTNALVSITAVGAGASLGREGALIQSGAGFGSWLGRTFRLRDDHVKALLACGAAGGIAASYNVPIGATVFAMEVLLGSLALDLFGPIIICSVIATAISRTLSGDAQAAYDIPPQAMDHWEILLTLVLGTVIGVASVGFIRLFAGVRELFRWLQPFRSTGPLLVMFVLGAIGIWFPALFGNGYSTVNKVVTGDLTAQLEQMGGVDCLRVLLLLPILKLFVTALCRASGVPGGLFTPSLFVGALFGAGFGLALSEFMPGDLVTASPAAYALVAMGAMVAGTMQAPITAILMIFEMTQSYGMILPLMAGCIASALMSRLLQTGSLYTEPLRRRGIVLPNAAAPLWIKQPAVRNFMRTDVSTVRAAESFDQVVEAFLRAPGEADRLYVVNDRATFLGVVSLHEIKTFFRETAHLETVIAADIMNTYFPVVYADEPMSTAVEILADSDAERLPVLENRTSRKLLGSVSKRDLLAEYRAANLARVDRNRQ